MKNCLTNSFIIVILSAFLSGCDQKCIDADDFGHATYYTSARYTKEELEGQKEDKQVAPWRNSKYILNGKPLTIMVRGWDSNVEGNTDLGVSAWCPWFGRSDDVLKLSDLCSRFRECQFENNEMCTDTTDANIINAPCIFKKGVGLYALIPDPGTDPNMTTETRRKPKGISFHVGAPRDGYEMYEVIKGGQFRLAGGRVFDFASDDDRLKYKGSELHFKILDKFYDDNSGKYQIVIKSGVNVVGVDPFAVITDLIQDFLFGEDRQGGIIQRIYMGIVDNTAYQFVVSAILILFVIYTGLAYLLGDIELTKTELLVRIVKIAIVSALLNTETSWSFFNDYLFVYFVGGLQQMIQILLDLGATGPGSVGIIGLIVAPQTMYKVVSLIFVDWFGVIYVAIFYIILIVMLFIFFQATVIYLTALMVISLLIILGPIFVCFLLFDFTRSLFENWLKQIISHAFQPIILFTGIALISIMLRHEIYASLGFKVCQRPLLNMLGDIIGGDDGNGGAQNSIFDSKTSEDLGPEFSKSLFSWWFPEPANGSGFSRETKIIPIPEAHFPNQQLVGFAMPTGGENNPDYCQAYECIGPRYIDLPFLDPVRDVRRINKFWSGDFIQLDGIVLIIIALYLLYKVNNLAVNVARFLTGTTNNQSNIQSVSEAATTSMKNFLGSIPGGVQSIAGTGVKIVGGAASAGASVAEAAGAQKMASGLRKIESVADVVAPVLKQGIGTVVGAKLSEWKEDVGKKIADKISPSGLIDKARINSLKKEALSGNLNPLLLSEVKKKTGLTPESINKDAITNYQKALSKEIYGLTDPKLSDEERQKAADKTAQTLSNKNLISIRHELAQMKYGKGYDDLSEKQKQDITKITNKRELRVLASEAKKTKEFRDAYVRAYKELSDKGVGLLGKNIKFVRSIKKAQHRLKEYDERDRQKVDVMLQNVTGVIGRGSVKYASQSKDDKAFLIKRSTRGEKRDFDNENVRNAKLDAAIRLNSSRAKENITNPEFLAKVSVAGHPRAAYYNGLAQEKLRSDLALQIAQNKYVKGDQYLRTEANNPERNAAINNLNRLRDDTLENDIFISRSGEYSLKAEAAKAHFDAVKKYIASDSNSIEEIRKGLYNKLHAGYQDGSISASELNTRMAKMDESIGVYYHNQDILMKIKDRRDIINKTFDDNINKIKSYMKGKKND